MNFVGKERAFGDSYLAFKQQQLIILLFGWSLLKLSTVGIESNLV